MHKEEEDLVRKVFQGYADGARRQLEAHPGDEDLERFITGSLPAKRLEAVRDHLTVCPHCLVDALDQKAFPLVEPPEDALRLSDDQVEERWRKVRRKLVAQAVPEPRSADASIVRRPHRRPAWIAVAATAVVLLGLLWLQLLYGGWLGSSRPSVNAQIVTLLPEESGSGAINRGSQDGIQRVSLSPVADSVLLVLTVPSLADFSAYRIDLIEANEKKPSWRDSSIRPTEGLSFTASFPRSALPPGRYLMRLWGREGSDLELIASYRFRVAHVD